MATESPTTGSSRLTPEQLAAAARAREYWAARHEQTFALAEQRTAAEPTMKPRRDDSTTTRNQGDGDGF